MNTTVKRRFSGAGFATLCLTTTFAAAITAGCAAPAASRSTGAATTLSGPNDPRRANPDAALAAMRAGNARFVAGTAVAHDGAFERVAATANGQYPVACVLGCADSRTSPDAIFDLGIGEAFVCRVAGAAAGTNIDASLEYGTAVLGAPVIVVLGHGNCGAMKAAIADKPLPGSLPALIAEIRPAVVRARAAYPNATADELLEAATREQVMGEVRRLQKESPVLRERVANGSLKIVGAMYSLEDGRVTWLSEATK